MTITTMVILGTFIVPIFLAFVYKKIQKAKSDISFKEMKVRMKKTSREKRDQLIAAELENIQKQFEEKMTSMDIMADMIDRLERSIDKEEDNNLRQQILEDKVSNIKIEIEDYVNALNKLSKSFTGLPESGFVIDKFEHEVLTGLKHIFLNYTTNLEQFTSTFLEKLPKIFTVTKVENRKVRIKTYDNFYVKTNYTVVPCSRETFNLTFKHFEHLDYNTKILKNFFRFFSLALVNYKFYSTRFLNVLTEVYDEKLDEDNKRYFNPNYVKEQINFLVKTLTKIYEEFHKLKNKFSYFIETNEYPQLVDDNINFGKLLSIDFTKEINEEDSTFITCFLNNIFVNSFSNDLSLVTTSSEIIQKLFNIFDHSSFLIKKDNSFKMNDSDETVVECKISFKNESTLSNIIIRMESARFVRDIFKHRINFNDRYAYNNLMLFMYSYGVTIHEDVNRIVQKSSLLPRLVDLVPSINSKKWIAIVGYSKTNYYINTMYDLHILHYIEQVEIFKSKIQDIREKPATQEDYRALIDFKFKILEFINLYFYSGRFEISSPKTEVIENITYKKMYDAYVKFLVDGQEVFLNPNKTLYNKAYFLADIIYSPEPEKNITEMANTLEVIFNDLEDILLGYKFKTL